MHALKLNKYFYQSKFAERLVAVYYYLLLDVQKSAFIMRAQPHSEHTYCLSNNIPCAKQLKYSENFKYIHYKIIVSYY